MVFGLVPQRVFLDPNAVDLALNAIGETRESIAYEWQDMVARGRMDFPPAPGRSTLYDWIADGFPSIKKWKSKGVENTRFYQIIAFCALIDVDPLAMFDLERNGYGSRFAEIRKLIQRKVGALGALEPLYDLFAPDEEWPNGFLAKRFWGRDWHSIEFDNRKEFQSHDDALLKVCFEKRPGGAPRCVHIAYRRWDTRDIDTMWRFYGTVVSIDRRNELFNEGGVHKIMKALDSIDLAFRTHFGGRKVEFKLASIHPFNLEIDFPFNDKSIIGFEW